MNKLPDDFAQQLVEEFERCGKAHAYAKAALRGIEEERKILKSQLMKVAEAEGTTSITRQESFAYNHVSYGRLRDKLVKAVEDEALRHYECRLCEIKFEAWRSINANERQASR